MILHGGFRSRVLLLEIDINDNGKYKLYTLPINEKILYIKNCSWCYLILTEDGFYCFGQWISKMYFNKMENSNVNMLI